MSNNAAASVLAGRQVQAVCQDCGGTTARRHGNEQPVEFRHIEPGARAACGLHAHAVSVGRDHLDISGAADQQDMAANQKQIIGIAARSEEHTSELQSLMRISYAVFCLKKKKK